MFIAGMLLFSITVPAVSYSVSKTENPDRGKLAASTTLIAWGSMLVELLLAKAS